jgi:hypothetical protein
LKFSSSKNQPYILSPPLPLPTVMSPPWIINSGIAKIIHKKKKNTLKSLVHWQLYAYYAYNLVSHLQKYKNKCLNVSYTRTF